MARLGGDFNMMFAVSFGNAQSMAWGGVSFCQKNKIKKYGTQRDLLVYSYLIFFEAPPYVHN